MIHMHGRHSTERGATALFLVIFAAVLLTVITVGFAQMMINEQSNSLDNVLSQAAYDSATAGVEDAKRTILACKTGSGAFQLNACNAITAQQCDTNNVITGIPSGSEARIQTSSGTGGDLDQAYTCVKVNMTPSNYLWPVKLGQPVMIPLNAAGAVSRVDIEWQQQGDAGGNASTSMFGGGSCHNSPGKLCSTTAWGNAPALMEAQFILPSPSFTLQSLDATNATGQTMYLRPYLVGALTSTANWQPRYTADSPNTVGSPNAPVAIKCNTAPLSAYATGGYACLASITGLSVPAQSTISYLRLNTVYKGANVRITLYDAAGGVVNFHDVQPAVDSTGRANDVYRRIESRLSFGNPDAFPLPQNAVDLGGSLCKDFGVTTTGVSSPSSCTP